MPDARYEKTAQGAVEAPNEEARAVRFYAEPGGRVFLHPSCTLFSAAQFEHRWLVFGAKQHAAGGGGGGGAVAGGGAGGGAGKLYIRDVTSVSPLALLLFGGEVAVHHDRGTVTVDSVATFGAPGRTAVLVRELRAELDKLLLRKVRPHL